MPQQPDQRRLLDILLADSTEHGVLLLDTQGRITAWLAARKSSSATPPKRSGDNRLACSLRPRTPPKAFRRARSRLRRAAPRPRTTGCFAKTASGSGRPACCRRLRDSGELLGFGKILRNRTDLKGQLEGFENQVQQLEVEKQRRDNFVGVLAHELRGPLQALYLAADMLEPLAKHHEDGQFALDVLHRQCDAINRLVDDLLDATRLGTGKLKLELGEVPLTEVLRRR